MTEQTLSSTEGKHCTRCGAFKSYDQFNRRSAKADGRQSECRECFNARSAAYRRENPEKIRKSINKYRSKNKEKTAAQRRAWAARNQERLRENSKAYRRKNGERIRARERERYKREKQKRLDAWLASQYKITRAEFDELLLQQDHACAICKSIYPQGRGGFHVDHDHKTGQVRGLLCHNCNTGLGKLGDNLDGLERAVQYLQNGPKQVASALASMRQQAMHDFEGLCD